VALIEEFTLPVEITSPTPLNNFSSSTSPSNNISCPLPSSTQRAVTQPIAAPTHHATRTPSTPKPRPYLHHAVTGYRSRHRRFPAVGYHIVMSELPGFASKRTHSKSHLPQRGNQASCLSCIINSNCWFVINTFIFGQKVVFMLTHTIVLQHRCWPSSKFREGSQIESVVFFEMSA
jgi:hypothetical protein